MTIEHQDTLTKLFRERKTAENTDTSTGSSGHAAADDVAFCNAVMTQVDQGRQRHIVSKIAAAVILFVAAPHAQDLALQLTQILTIELIDIDADLVSQLLAPLNTVGAALSALTLALRAAYLRVFR